MQSPSQATTGPSDASDILTTGHMLVADPLSWSASSMLRSPNGMYTLKVTGTSVAIDQELRFPSGLTRSTELWWKFAYPTGYNLNDRTTLRMESTGNLTLVSSTRHVIWSSRTTGTGTHNYLRMLDDGDLVIRTDTGKTVWSSGTTAQMVGGGAVLRSGKVLINRYRDQFVPPTTLTMQRDGNLAVRYLGRVTWSSNTHVAGSYATLSTTGDLKVYSPHNVLLWHSRTIGTNPYLSVDQCGAISVHVSRATWRVPANAPRTCGN